MREGAKVRLIRDVERFPHFTVPAGATGRVVRYDESAIAVRLDESVEGAGEWDNEIHWYADMFDAADFREVFREDTEALEGES